MIAAAAAATSTPLNSQVAALLGSVIIAALGSFGGLAVWWNRRTAKRLNAAQAKAAEAEAGKFHAEAANHAITTVLSALKEVERTAQAATKRAMEAEILARRLREWAREVVELMESHGLDVPALPDMSDIVGHDGEDSLAYW